jgi:very-short-patch-repair endonuclease
MASVLHAGPGTFVNRRSGAHLWGIPGFPPVAPQVSRLRGTGGQVPSRAELLHLRYLPPHLTTSVAGIPVVTLPFLMFQLAGSEREDRVERALNAVCTKSPAVLARMHELLPELAEHGRNGIVFMREWLRRNPPGSRPVASGLEGRFQQVLRAAGERPLDRQVDVGGHEWIGRVDFCDREVAALFEVDSLLHHTSELDVAQDAERDARLLAAGWAAVERIPEEWIWYDPDRAVAVVRETRRRLRRRLPRSGT